MNSDAVATAVLTFAIDTTLVNGVAGKPGNRLGQLRPYNPTTVDPMADRYSS